MRRVRPDSVRLLQPSSAGGRELSELDRVELVKGTLFLTHPDEFRAWADGRKRLVMEDFYREQRRRFDLLMEGDEPAGGRWNFDPENREPPPRDRRPPRPYRPREGHIDEGCGVTSIACGCPPSARTVRGCGPPRTVRARRALERFVESRLPDFGRWQDAMLHGERFMWHAHLSSSLNLGLLHPLDVAEAAQRAYREGHAPIGAAEGFVRQVIGWREYVGHVLAARARLALDERAGRRPAPARLPLERRDRHALRCRFRGRPARDGVCAHIVRLMVFGNLLLLRGVHPREALDWFHRAFIDGYEWVMGPNVVGMATYGDGGRMMTKPYAAGGRYIDRMSDFCKECRFDRVREKAMTRVPSPAATGSSSSETRTVYAATAGCRCSTATGPDEEWPTVSSRSSTFWSTPSRT